MGGSEAAPLYNGRKRFNREFAESTEDTESFETAQCATSYLRDSALVPAHLVSGVLFV
jgi:hypothetical protein